jgi:hypothetical protein
VEETIGYEVLFSAEEGMIMRRSLTIVGSYGGDLRPARSPPQKNLQKTPRRTGSASGAVGAPGL